MIIKTYCGKLPIHVDHNPSAATTCIALAFSLGEGELCINSRGLLHLKEHLVMRRYRQINSTSGYSNGYTSKDWVLFVIQVLKKDVCECFDDLLEAIVSCDTQGIDTEKQIITSEIEQLHNNEDWLIGQQIEEGMWGKPYSIPCCGLIDNISSFTEFDVLNVHFRRKKCAIAVSGYLNSEMLDYIQRAIVRSELDCSEDNNRDVEVIAKKRNRERNAPYDGYGALSYAFRVPGLRLLSDTTFACHNFVADFFSNRRNGLGSLLKTELGLAYYCESGFRPYRDSGVIYLTVKGNRKHFGVVEAVVKDFLAEPPRIAQRDIDSSLFYYCIESEKLLGKTTTSVLYALYGIDYDRSYSTLQVSYDTGELEDLMRTTLGTAEGVFIDHYYQ